MGWGKGCIRFFGQTGSKLWLSWQPKAPIDLQWGKWCLHLFSIIFYWIFTKLAGIQDRRKISDEFKFQLNWIIHFSVTRPWALEKLLIDYWEKDISMLAHSLLIRSLSNLQVTRTGIRSQTSLNSDLIRPVTLMLFALDCWKRSQMILYRAYGSLWNLQITWAGTRSHKCLKFGQSGLFTLELPALIAENTIFYLLGMLDRWGIFARGCSMAGVGIRHRKVFCFFFLNLFLPLFTCMQFIRSI